MSYTLRDGLQLGNHYLKNAPTPVSHNSQNVSESEYVYCGVCSQRLEDLNICQREDHYEKHFLADAQGE
jgi:hypothetical protein